MTLRKRHESQHKHEICQCSKIENTHTKIFRTHTHRYGGMSVCVRCAYLCVCVWSEILNMTLRKRRESSHTHKICRVRAHTHTHTHTHTHGYGVMGWDGRS